MQTVMFTETIFGPIRSRRLGSSLGVNLSPRDGKVCSFDCLYCEAGFNSQGAGTTGLPSRGEVFSQLDKRLSDMKSAGETLDVITFSGNGEPTIHPDFSEIIEDTIALRNKYFPRVQISVLTNSTMLHKPEVVEALRKVDKCMLKLDSAVEGTLRDLDRPVSPHFNAQGVIEQLAAFGDKAIIQTMLTRGTHNGRKVDNTTDEEISALIDAYRYIRPGEVVIYSLDRPTPETNLFKVPKDELMAIADRIRRETDLPVTAI